MGVGFANRQAMTLEDLLADELQDLYDAEHQLVKALPQLAKAAEGDALRAAFESHLEETRTHLTRLDEVFVLMAAKAAARHCAGIAAIIAEGQKLLAHADVAGAVRDAGIIAGAQKAEHYEICGYGTCAAWARTLGLDEVAAKLEETLEEERAADQTLNDLAEQEVNISATHEGSPTAPRTQS
ncbi:MAG TPA: ferritin-like domain-containing protein [Vicinamibacterales bacterium]|nr:ferritin-like domain-containing protein [Vicinamibacterales bacterium]